MLTFFKALVTRLVHFRSLYKSNFSVKFIHEGNTVVQLPRSSLFDALTGRGYTLSRSISYFHRPNSEALLRRVIYGLYADGYIPADKSIIDIGSWIADNSIVWSKQLKEGSYVFAIDPSPENQSYGQKVASLNDVSNIKFIEAVCTENEGEKLDFEGDLGHTSFYKKPLDGKIVSTTLDAIIANSGNPSIGLLHVDVEGLEFSVLKGASKIIKNDLPIISFEQHISQEDIFKVTDFLREFGYRVFMVNEVLPGCSLDCRNFLAFHSSKKVPNVIEFEQKNASGMGIYSAIIGESLIEVDLKSKMSVLN